MFDVLLTATATTFSGVWLYELVYHYFWGSSLASLFSDFSHFSVTIYPGWPFPVWFALPVILFPLLKKQYITLNKPLLVTLAVSMGLFALWFNLGFPQFFYPQYYYGPLLTPAQVRDIGYVMNSLSKLLAIVPAFLFCEKGKFTWRQVEANQILQDFKNAFLLLLFGGLLVSLPLVGSIGLILIIAGISILLLSINGLGKFDFPQFTQFRSAVKRFIQSIVVALVILIVGLIVITAPLGSFIQSAISIPDGAFMLNNAAQMIPGLQKISYEVFALVTIVYWVWIYAWLKICFSIKALGTEFDQPRLVRTATFYLVYAAVGFLSIVSLFLMVISGTSGFFFGTTLTTAHLYDVFFFGAFYGFLARGPWLIFSFILLGQSALIALGSHIGYSSLKELCQTW
jgi:hypothetical protein